DPDILVAHWQFVLGLSAILICGKVLSITFGALVSGQNLKTSMQAGLSLAQIGEFSYIIATLGITLKVTNELLYPIAVAVSVLTTFTSPYMVKGSEGMYRWVDKKLPIRVRKAMDSYSLLPDVGPMTSRKEYLTNFALKLLLNTVLIIGIFLAMSQVFLPWVEGKMQPFWAMLLSVLTTFLMAAPFFWALVFSRINGHSFSDIWKQRGARSSFLVLSLLRGLWGLILMGVMIIQFVPEVLEGILLISLVAVFVMIFYARLEAVYGSIEGRFLKNLNAKKPAADGVTKYEIPPLAPWDAHLVEFMVPQEANFVGLPLERLSIREKYGVSIAMIKRGGKRITAPGGTEMLMPM
ncbi:MAG: sodium:proton antiporter, partial [Proteobacteria bacterium]